VDGVVWLWEELKSVSRDQGRVVKLVERIEKRGIWVDVGLVIDDPACSIWVQTVWNDIEEGLELCEAC
jgi:hypothetical protein